MKFFSIFLICSFVHFEDAFCETIKVNSIAAVIEKNVVTEKSVFEELKYMFQDYAKGAQIRDEKEMNDWINDMRKKIISQRTDEILINEFFEKEKGQIPDSYLEIEYKSFIDNNFIGSRENFLRYLKSKNQSDRDFRQKLKENLIISYMESKHAQEFVEISPKAVKEFYFANQNEFMCPEKVYLRQLVISIPPEQDNISQKDKLDDILNEIKHTLNSKEDNLFDKLVKKYTNLTPEKKDDILGWVAKEDINKTFESVFNLQKGEISEPIVFGENIFVFYVEDLQNAHVKPLSDVIFDVQIKLNKQNKEKFKENWLKSLRDKGYIKEIK